MTRPQLAEPTFWKLFDLLRKIVGWAFLVGGLVVGSYFLVGAFILGGSVNVNGVPSTDLGNRLFAVLLPYVVTVFGWLIVRAKPYHPSN